MSAQILPFPKKRSELQRPRELTQEVHHLDLTALRLRDRGWQAKAGVCGFGPTEMPSLSTNAPEFEVTAALVNAFDDLCGFLEEMFEYLPEELPNLDKLQPCEMHKVRSEFAGGRILGYSH